MNDKRCSSHLYHSGNSKGPGSSVPGAQTRSVQTWSVQTRSVYVSYIQYRGQTQAPESSFPQAPSLWGHIISVVFYESSLFSHFLAYEIYLALCFWMNVPRMFFVSLS